MATSKEKLQIIVDAQGIAKTKAQLKGMEKATGASTKSFGLMAVGIAGATVALYAMGKAVSAAIRVSKEFEQGMANVKAISGATGAEFKALEANAKLLGRTTKFTATEVAGLQTEFSKLGFTATEINKVTKGTLALAAATGSDLAVSAAVGGATLRGFGLDAKETGRVTDVMAKSFSSSALDMTKFSDSMKYVAPVAKMAGFSIEGTTAIMGQLANAGIDGSMAGTALRKIFLELSNESSKLSKRLGGSVKSVDELIPALQKLNEEGISTAEMKDLVGQRAISAFSIMLSGSKDIDTLAESLRNAGGSAQEMADIQLDTLEGKMTIMNSAMEGLGIAIGDKLSPTIQGAVEGFTSLLGVMTDIITKGDQAFIKFGDMSDAVSQSQISATQTRAEFKRLTDQLLHLARQTELSTNEEERRNGIIDELQKKYPNYLSNLDQEADDYMALSRNIANASKSLDEYLKKQMNVAIAKQFSDKTAEINVKLVELEQTLAQLEDPMTHLFLKSGEDAGGFLGFIGLGEEGFKDQASAVAGVKQEMENLELELGNIMVLYEKATINSQALSNVPPPSTDLIQFEEAQGPPLPPAPSIVPGPTVEQMEIKLSELDEFYIAQHEASMIAQGLEFEMQEAHYLALAESDEEYDAVQDIFTEKYKQRADLKKKIDSEELKQKLAQMSALLNATSGFIGEFVGGAKIAARMQQVAAVINTWSGATAALAPPPVGAGPIAGIPLAATIVMAGLANVMKISKSIGDFKGAATGMDEIISQPTMIMAGEGGKAEHIGITPLEGPNLDGPQGGGSVTVNISGNVMTEEFTTEQIIPALKEALRRGENLDHAHVGGALDSAGPNVIWSD